MKKAISIILLLYVVTTVFTACENSLTNDTSAQFHNAADAVGVLQSNITSKIAECESLLTSTKTEDVLDADVLKKLQTEIDAAKTLEIAIPAIAAESDTVKAQTAELEAKKAEMQSQLDALSHAANAIDDSKQALADKLEAEKQAKLDEAITLKGYHTATSEDSRGYKINATIKMTSWLKGSDYETLNRAWKKAGGSVDFPHLTEFRGGMNYKFDMNSAIFAIGTCEFTNVTGNGFDITAGNEHTPSISIIPGVMHEFMRDNTKEMRFTNGSSYYPKSFKMKTFFSGVYYDSGWKYHTGSSSVSAVKASMTTNRWGPVVFFIAYNDIFTPATPDGNPELDELLFACKVFESAFAGNFITKEFKIEKTW